MAPRLLLLTATVAAAVLAGLAKAQQATQSTQGQHPQPQPQPFTVSAETTYRPEHSRTAEYNHMPLTPDLGRLADSIASEPSVADAMRQARAGWGMDNTRDEL